MEIADDGIGINPDALSKPGSLGILGLRERLHARAGTLSVLPRSEGGTMVRVILPRSDA